MSDLPTESPAIGGLSGLAGASTSPARWRRRCRARASKAGGKSLVLRSRWRYEAPPRPHQKAVPLSAPARRGLVDVGDRRRGRRAAGIGLQHDRTDPAPPRRPPPPPPGR